MGKSSLSISGKKLERHKTTLPVDSDDANSVIAGRADRTRHVRSMIVYITRVTWRRWVTRLGVIKNRRVIMCEVPTVDVIYKTIPVVINAVPRNLARIHPDVIVQVFVVDVDSCIDNPDYHAAAA